MTITEAYTGDVITATDSANDLTGASLPFTVNPGALASFTITASGGGDIGTQTAGAPFTITITAYDSSGNVATNYAGPAVLSDTTGMINPTSTGAFTNGVCSVSVTITKALHG